MTTVLSTSVDPSGLCGSPENSLLKET
jgi:hypothetical protein